MLGCPGVMGESLESVLHKRKRPGNRRIPYRLPVGWPVLVGAAVAFAVAIAAYSCWPRRPVENTGGATGPVGETQSTRRNGGADSLLDTVVEPAASVPPTPGAMVEEAGRLARWLIGRIPNDPDSLETVARVQFSRGDTAEALKSWEKCLELNPGYAYAYHGMGLIAAKKGEQEEAVRCFRRALELAPAAGEPQTELAAVLMQLGRTEEAVPLLEQSTRALYGSARASRFARASQLLGKAYLTLERYEQAKRHFEKFLGDFPDDSNARFGLATACARLGEAEMGNAHMAKFKELRAGEAKARMARKEEPYDELQTRDELATHYTTAGRVCDGAGYHREARKLWERAAVLDPKDVGCRELLVRACQRDGEPREAVQVLQQLAALVPASPGYPMEMGRLHAVLKEYELAEKAFNRVCGLAPLDWMGYAALAELYLEAGQKPREAVRLAQTAVQLAPGPATYQLLAEARRRSGDLPGARAAIEQAAGATSPPTPPDESAKSAQEKR